LDSSDEQLQETKLSNLGGVWVKRLSMLRSGL